MAVQTLVLIHAFIRPEWRNENDGKKNEKEDAEMNIAIQRKEYIHFYMYVRTANTFWSDGM